jgi:hypothetical protein
MQRMRTTKHIFITFFTHSIGKRQSEKCDTYLLLRLLEYIVREYNTEHTEGSY